MTEDAVAGSGRRTIALEARDVVTGYGEVDILHGVSAVVHTGEMVAIIGPNGAGKSTLLRAIFGLLPTRAGSVHLLGEDVTNRPPDELVKRGLGYVPQVDNVFPSLTILENLEMGAFVRRDGFSERAEQMFAMFPDLASRRGEVAGRLSGGQRQMLALARAMMLDPKILLLDEPSASLAPKMVGNIFERIKMINEGGTGILLVEQNAREALSVCDRAYVLAMGLNRLEGEAKSMLANEEVGRLYLGA
jgi:ABC-type branched-subunit amino acid transport system ATPase component